MATRSYSLVTWATKKDFKIRCVVKVDNIKKQLLEGLVYTCNFCCEFRCDFLLLMDVKERMS